MSVSNPGQIWDSLVSLVYFTETQNIRSILNRGMVTVSNSLMICCFSHFTSLLMSPVNIGPSGRRQTV